MSNGTIAVSQLEMLTQSGTGTITINPPNTDTDRVLTLPDETGTVLTGVSSLVAGNLTGSVPTSAISNGSITSAKLTGDAVPIGVGQTWTNVAGSRATGTTYTNSTGKPIFVAVSPTPSGTLIGTFNINGSAVAIAQHTPSGGGGGSGFTFVIPNGNTYSVTNNSNFNIAYWWELR